MTMEETISKCAHPNPNQQENTVSDVRDVQVRDRNNRKHVLSGILVCCMPCYWLRTNTSLRKASLTVVTLLVTSLLVASPVLFLISSVPANEQPRKECKIYEDEDCLIESVAPDIPLHKCDSLPCKDIARRIRYSLSWDHEPCKNFYNFACGGWSESQKADSSHPSYSYDVDLSISTLNKKILLFIQLYTVLDQLGGYLPPGSVGPNNLTPLIASILKVSGTPLFDISIGSHLRKKSAPSVYIDLPNGIVKTRLQNNQQIFLVKNIEQKLIDLEAIVFGMLPKLMNPNEMANEIQQTLLFASTVDQLLPGRKQLRYELNELNEASSYKLDKLQEEFPIVNWRDLFKEMIPDFENTPMNIYILSPSYMNSLTDIIKKFPKRIIHNALLAMYAKDFLHYLMDTKNIDSQDLYCTMLTIHLYPYPISGLYIHHYTQESLNKIKAKAEDMFANLKLSYFRRVEKATWIDNESRWKALDVISNLTGRFIAWPSLRNISILDQIMNDMTVSNDFFDNIMSHYRQKRIALMSLKHIVPYNIVWPYPFVVNSFYDPVDNCVFMPLSLLMQPCFSDGVPIYISYATIGMILSHEMMHALDYVGFHSKNVSPLWKQSKSLSALQSRLTCIANSYHISSKKGLKFLGKDIQIEFDGNFTLDETTADLSGVHVAWGAWRHLINGDKEVTLSHLPLPPSKLFFLSLAQLYCTKISTEDYIMAIEENFHMTPLERVNGLVRNTFVFSESYQCPANSPMNPTAKCAIW